MLCSEGRVALDLCSTTFFVMGYPILECLFPVYVLRWLPSVHCVCNCGLLKPLFCFAFGLIFSLDRFFSYNEGGSGVMSFFSNCFFRFFYFICIAVSDIVT